MAVAIADGKRLSRVIVLKSLSKQMSDTMAQRLGGLVDRRIYFMPFTRKLSIDVNTARQIRDLLDECRLRKGILIAHPEHILSFKLAGIERLISDDKDTASQLLRTQQWLNCNARDVLDESDEVLDVNFQLIYSLGNQRMMDGQPDRWLIAQALFDLVKQVVPTLQDDYPNHIEVSYRSTQAFPTLRILSPEVGQAMISKLAENIVDSQLPGLSFVNIPTGIRRALRAFIQELDVKAHDCSLLQSYYRDQDAMLSKILHIRGLLGHGVLLHAIQAKRWSVNYGLQPDRCMLAVPYRAKGVPAPNAEFGHPDVAVALTCLSYYYAGLSGDQTRKAISFLERADDPSSEYLSWIQKHPNSSTPPLHWTAVNLEDDSQFQDHLFPAIRYSKKAIDYYLVSVVFPKEGKEFDEKISTSGWDIPATQGPNITTGFSGTNDNQFIIPLSIAQQDLPQLRYTSAMVLNYVLQDKNLEYRCFQTEKQQQVSARGFIEALEREDSRVTVVIDVGAQILDLQNVEFVKAWLLGRPDAKAGIFFDDDDNAVVLTRDLKQVKLSSSSFQTRMDECLVYLDEVHTRGTDLKLPLDARAVVTLGPGLTKDRLVQGKSKSIRSATLLNLYSLYEITKISPWAKSHVRRASGGS